MTAYDGRTVEIRFSRGANAVPYLLSWEDNVLRPPDMSEWPPSLLRQVRSYTARPSWFSETDAAALAAGLGRISKFQSLNSEDAVTWSWFGTLALADAKSRRRSMQWLYETLGLSFEASACVRIEQWMRVMHPNAQNSAQGPEIDARIDDVGVALIYVEAKWNATLGVGKGAVEGTRDDQIVLRRKALRGDPKFSNDAREFLILGVSNTEVDLAAYEEAGKPGRPVRIAWITWSKLAECDSHPLADDFRRYLEWKRSLAS